jgi:hypothetical protein
MPPPDPATPRFAAIAPGERAPTARDVDGDTWSNPSPTDRIADGIKTLWLYRYPTAPASVEQLALGA